MGNLSLANKPALSQQRPTWAEINREALAANFHIVKNRVGPAVSVMAVVKANAYGHGAVNCARGFRKKAPTGLEWPCLKKESN